MTFSSLARIWTEHLQHLRDCLATNCGTTTLYAKMSKCAFARTELEFLGHILSGDGLRVDPKKTSAVADWPVPRDISQLRSFLGMANYFRKFLHHFAQRTMPLTRLCCVKRMHCCMALDS